MQRVLLAVGMEVFEEAIKREFNDDDNFTFIQRAVVYREAVLSAVQDENPDILVLREGLRGGISALKLLKSLRMAYNGRIVFIAEEHENNQTAAFVKKVSELGVYDVVWGQAIDIDILCRHIRRPSTYAELMSQLGVNQKEDEDDEFEQYTLTKVVKKESTVAISQEDGTHSKNRAVHRNPAQETVSVSQHPVSAHDKQPNATVVSTGNTDGSTSLNPGIPRTSSPSGISTGLQGSTPATPTQPPVTTVQQPNGNPTNAKQPPSAKPDNSNIQQGQKQSALPTNVLTSADLKEMIAAQEKAAQERKAGNQSQKGKNRQESSAALPVVVSGVRPQLPKHQSVLFLGSRDGIGCTSIAFNTALMLAADNKKVIYIDFKEELPSQVIRLNLNQNYGGLEKFLLDFKRNPAYVNQCCLSLNQDKRFGQLPALDILGFSINYINAGVHYDWGGTLAQTVKELQKQYDYVVCDSFANVNAKSFLSLFDAVDKIALVTTQDSLHATETLWTSQHLSSKGYSFGSNTCVVLNKFENVHPLEQDIQKIFDIQTVFRISADNKGFLIADSNTMPYLYGAKWVKNRTYFQRIKDWVKK